MRLVTACLGIALMGPLAIAAPSDYSKARVFSVNIGSVVPMPEDAGEAKSGDQDRTGRAADTMADDHAVFVVLRAEKGMVVGKFSCDDHCLTLKNKIAQSREVEYREQDDKLWMKLPNEMLEGTRIKRK